MDLNVVKYLANLVGAPEPAFRLLLSIILSHPMAWIFLAFINDKRPDTKNVYFVLCGFGIGVFNFGFDIYHSILAILFTYISLLVMGPSKWNTIINFVFHMSYLVIGYWITETDTYDIKWTMPHCVLVLRLIGLSFDLWDGSKDQAVLSSSFKKTALRREPTLLEIAAHVFFPASYLVGPQFSMTRLLRFIDGYLVNVNKPSSLVAGLKRAALGLTYLLMYQVGVSYFPADYFLTEEFDNSSFIKKHIMLGIWGKIFLCKYVSCWLLTEGACISFGLAYNGSDENKIARWDGCRNINLKTFEGCTKFGHYIESFNMNTNTWAAQYIYKRMAFLGSRHASQIITLLLLALWHGLHSGYYMTFFMEFTIIFLERDLENILNKNEAYLNISQSKVYKIVMFGILRLYTAVFMGYCLIPFALLSYSKWWQVYSSLYFSGFVVFIPWAVVYKPIIRALFKPTKTVASKN